MRLFDNATGSREGASYLGMRGIGAVLVWGAFWALVAAAKTIGLGAAGGTWLAGYVASRLVWGRWRCSFARGMVALAVAAVQLGQYWWALVR